MFTLVISGFCKILPSKLQWILMQQFLIKDL
jgi:hypothetical protein